MGVGVLCLSRAITVYIIFALYVFTFLPCLRRSTDFAYRLRHHYVNILYPYERAVLHNDQGESRAKAAQTKFLAPQKIISRKRKATSSLCATKSTQLSKVAFTKASNVTAMFQTQVGVSQPQAEAQAARENVEQVAVAEDSAEMVLNFFKQANEENIL